MASNGNIIEVQMDFLVICIDILNSPAHKNPKKDNASCFISERVSQRLMYLCESDTRFDGAVFKALLSWQSGTHSSPVVDTGE